MDIHGIIYCITNTIAGKQYVGQTTADNPYHRWYQHVSCAKYQKYPLYKSIRKYGIDSFRYDIIATAPSQLDLNKAEEYWITVLNTTKPHGYNIKEFSEGKGKHSVETISKISKGNLGKKRSEETKRKLQSAFKNRVWSEVTIEKRASKLRGRPLSDAHKRKISAAHSGKSRNIPTGFRYDTPVESIDIKTGIVKEYSSLFTAAPTPYLRDRVAMVIRGDRKTLNKQIWRRLS